MRFDRLLFLIFLFTLTSAQAQCVCQTLPKTQLGNQAVITAAEEIAASNAAPARCKITGTNPLCAYPKAAKYKGSGDSNNAANFTCKEPARNKS